MKFHFWWVDLVQQEISDKRQEQSEKRGEIYVIPTNRKSTDRIQSKDLHFQTNSALILPHSYR